MLQLFDLGGDHHGFCADQEDNRADRNHGVDKKEAEHFQQRAYCVRCDDPNYGLQPAVTHELRRGLPGSVELFQSTFDQQIG